MNAESAMYLTFVMRDGQVGGEDEFCESEHGNWTDVCTLINHLVGMNSTMMSYSVTAMTAILCSQSRSPSGQVLHSGMDCARKRPCLQRVDDICSIFSLLIRTIITTTRFSQSTGYSVGLASHWCFAMMEAASQELY
jgi:hypothetical protein